MVKFSCILLIAVCVKHNGGDEDKRNLVPILYDVSIACLYNVYVNTLPF